MMEKPIKLHFECRYEHFYGLYTKQKLLRAFARQVGKYRLTFEINLLQTSLVRS